MPVNKKKEIDREGATPFLLIYDRFLSRITSDMYFFTDEIDVYEQLQEILLSAIPRFRLPRFDIFDYSLGELEYIGPYNGTDINFLSGEAYAWVGGQYNIKLTKEEINLLSLCMLIDWLWQQLATTDLLKMKFSSDVMKFSSQANQLSKIKVLVDKAESDLKNLEDAYQRRELHEGDAAYHSTMYTIMEGPKYGLGITSSRCGSDTRYRYQ